MSDPHLQHLTEANRIFADQIKTADQKAAYVFTFLLAMLVWSTETRRAFSAAHLAEARPLALAISLVLCLSILTALGAAILVVMPRTGSGRSLFYWGAWPEAGERLRAARDAKNDTFLFDEYLQNTRTLATIASSKYRTVALALRALFCAVIAYALLLVLPAGI